MNLSEVKLLTNMHPTTNQKRVIAIVLAAPSPNVAGEQISGNSNMIAARDILVRLDIISVINGSAELTEKGRQVAQDENIADATGQLTSIGQQLAYGESQSLETAVTPANEPVANVEGFSSLLSQLIKG